MMTMYQKWVTPEGLRLIREWTDAGLTKREISDRIGVKHQTLHGWSIRFPELEAAMQPKGPEQELTDGGRLFQLAHSDYVTEVREWRTKRGHEIRVTKTKYVPGWVSAQKYLLSANSRNIYCTKENSGLQKQTDLSRKWMKPENLAQVKNWARQGMTDEQLSRNMGISRKTLRRWKQRCPEFAAALQQGRMNAEALIETELYNRALDRYVVEKKIREVDGKVKSIERRTRYVPGNLEAQIFWLQTRQPERWGKYKPQEGAWWLKEAEKDAEEREENMDEETDYWKW